MLQFFKKPGFKEKSKSFFPSLIKFEKTKNDGIVGSSKGSISSPLSSFEEEEESCSNEYFSIEENSIGSCITKLLPKILGDKSALGYFIQFMESRGEVSLIKFYLEVECFCSAYSNNELIQESIDINNSGSNENIYKNKLKDNIDKCACNNLRSSVSDSELDSISIDSNANSFEQGLPLSCSENKSKIANPPKNSSIINSNECTSKCKLQNSKDIMLLQHAMRIYKKYLKDNSFGPNHIPDELKTSLENAIISDDVAPIIKYLSECQQVIYKILEDDHIINFSRSDFYCKYQIDVLTSGNVKLSDILLDETAFFYFIEFMEMENKREFLDFWLSATNYKHSLLEKGELTDIAEAQSDALVIYEKYFSLQATTPLGFTDKIRFQIEQNICREDGKAPQPDCFDLPCQVVYNFLSKNYLPTFLESELFYKYLSEMINSIQSNLYSNMFHSPLKRAESDCSSEVSTFSSKTLPSKPSGTGKRKSRSISESMNIDTKQLYDPDSLWKRNKPSLSVGYMDNLGRFVTEIEPDPFRKNDKESKLSRAVKKLVHIEQDKTKEESAWKIAEMIVRDITSLTLGASNHPS